MTIETAQLVLAVITGVGFIIWLAGLQFLFRSARVGRPASQPLGDFEQPSAENWLLGSAEVEGQPDVLVKRAAALLVKQGSGAFGSVKILECTDDRLAFERVGPLTGSGQQSGWFRRGAFRFAPLGRERTRIDYAVERASLRWLLWLGALFQVLGLIALVVGSWILATRVAASPDPTMRWQTIQMVQAIHFLWPPFLFGALYRRGVTSVRATFEALAHNLPYAE